MKLEAVASEVDRVALTSADDSEAVMACAVGRGRCRVRVLWTAEEQ